jgi:hypothetical protein
VALADRLTDNELYILMDNGLQGKYPDLFAQYDRHIAEAKANRTKDLDEAMKSIRSQLEKDRPSIEQAIRGTARQRSHEFRTYVAPPPILANPQAHNHLSYANMGQAPSDEASLTMSGICHKVCCGCHILHTSFPRQISAARPIRTGI